MKKLNNKGFAISTMLYGLLIIILLVVAVILSTMAFSRKNSREFTEKIVNRLEQIKSYTYNNKNIVSAYTYNQTSGASNYCITGDEKTCEQISIMSDTSVLTGTIINYKVNDTETVRFHVMYDNGTTMTMQSQKNTINNTPWISAADYVTENTDGTNCSYTSCNDEGPMTALVALERATKSWTNVNDQTYTIGTTSLSSKGKFTGCDSYNSCVSNKYTLDSRTTKTRMITLQEAVNLGCTNSTRSCPIWMFNYLRGSSSFGGTSDNTKDPATGLYNYGYWTMNTTYNFGDNLAWYVYAYGRVEHSGNGVGNGTSSSDRGARAVVVVNK